MRTFAQDTTVSISRTRVEIDELLRAWKADAIQWTDELKANRCTLRFMWEHEGNTYRARFTITLPSYDKLRPLAKNKQTGQVSEPKFNKLWQARGQQEHRVLLLWLKASFNAVNAGIVPVESVFLPYLENDEGRTVAELFVPTLGKLAVRGELAAHSEE